MGSYEILSIGTKLKNLREKYNVRQEDLAGGEITRNLISQIEHGKANLTKNAAEIILKNLKKICGKNHITIDENIEYLMEDEKSQAEKILDKYIKELRDLMVYKDASFVDKLTEVEEFLVQWNITDKKVDIFELAGDYFTSTDDYYKSSLYYEKARALFDKYSKNSISILRKLSMVYFYMGEYEQDIKCCQFALDWFNDDLTEEYRCIFLFNSALCYIEIKQYYEAIKNLIKTEEIIKHVNINKYYEVLVEEAICLEHLEKYTESLDIYNKLLDIFKNTNAEQYVLVLANMLNLFRDSNDYINAQKTINNLVPNINKLNNNSKYLPSIYLELSKTFKWLKNLKKAEECCLKGFYASQKYTHYFVIDNIFAELIDIYCDTNNTEKIQKVKNDFFIMTSKENKLNTKIVFKLIGIYLKNNDTQSIQEIYDFSTKFIS
ncbi:MULTISPECIES: helix-turn-helix transcriptional regulator [Clostridium]|uniref:helix-turn-helix transcriptional regulator n=1 Tax=Clostridium TaxID=1485 RepID=UPI000827190A|nr:MULTISPECIES: helix-turn-helix transcriptional regulator [Clostridium]PJI08776.1 transcriptional regulator [Clostridium sp. CT7]